MKMRSPVVGKNQMTEGTRIIPMVVLEGEVGLAVAKAAEADRRRMRKAKYLIPYYGFAQIFDDGIAPGELSSWEAVLIIVWQCGAMVGVLIGAMFLVTGLASL